MKYKQILELNKSLSELKLPGVKFAYAVARNIQALKPEVTALQEAIKQSPEYQAYEKARVDLATKHASKDEKGKPVIVGNEFAIEDQEAFDKAIEELKEKHKTTIEAREQQLKDFNELLEKDVDVTLFKVALEDVPQNITTNQMTSIFEIIES